MSSIHYHHITLESKLFAVSKRVCERALFRERRVEEDIKKEMELCLTNYMFGRAISGVSISSPLSWFEMLKEDIYNRYSRYSSWARRRWPVQYNTKTLSAWQAFPELQKPEFGDTIVLTIASVD